jgi:molecular chaperone DnaK
VKKSTKTEKEPDYGGLDIDDQEDVEEINYKENVKTQAPTKDPKQAIFDKIPVSDTVLGIDFGSNSSAVSYWCDKKGKYRTIQLESNKKTLASIVAFNQNDKFVVGDEALRVMRKNPSAIFNDIKKRILNQNPFTYKGQQMYPHLVVAQIILELKREVEIRIGAIVKKTILTVPAYFPDSLRCVLKSAAELCQLQVIRIINEPTAAAVYYSQKYPESYNNCLFIDIGGQTLDFTIAHVKGNTVDVECTFGDPTGGYKSVDHAIVFELLSQISKQYGPEMAQRLERNIVFYQQVLEIAEEMKIKMGQSACRIYTISETFNINDINYLLTFKLLRKQFEACHLNFFRNIIGSYNTLMSKSIRPEDQLQIVIPIGGPATSKYLISQLQKMFPIPIKRNFDHITCVAKGACIYGKNLESKKNNILSDVVPLSIGVELENGVFEKIIMSNSKMPTQGSAVFSTTKDFQTAVLIKLLEGQRVKSSENHLLGTLYLDNIQLGFKGEPRIRLKITIDQNNILFCSAIDCTTNSERGIVIESPSRLKIDEVLKAKQLVKKYQKEDQKFYQTMKVRSTIKNILDHLRGLIATYTDKNFSTLKPKVDKWESEVEALSSLKHDNIVRLTGIQQELYEQIEQINLELELSGITRKRVR